MTQAGRSFGLTIGVVCDREDPAGLARVRVRYPMLGDIESDWSRVAVLYGGAGDDGAHGAKAIPELGDEVVVGFVAGDPKVAIVLGSIYSDPKPPPAQDKRDERIFRSRRGHVVVISDEEGEERIQLKTSSGQEITVDEPAKTITVKATSKVRVEAADEVSVKSDKAVRVEGAQEVSVKSTATVSVEGTQGVTVKAAKVTIDAAQIELGGSGAALSAVVGEKLLALFNTHVHATAARPAGAADGADDARVFSVITKLKG